MGKKKFKIEDYRLVQVDWIDAMDSETGWHSLNKLKKAQPEPVVSVVDVSLASPALSGNTELSAR